MKSPVLLLFTFVSFTSSERKTVSERHYNYDSSTCIKTSTKISQDLIQDIRESETSCPGLLCQFSAPVSIFMLMDPSSGVEEKSYIFHMGEVKTNCGGEGSWSKSKFSVHIVNQGEVKRKFDSQNKNLVDLQNGLVDVFLTGNDVHSDNIERVNKECEFTFVEKENEKGFTEVCSFDEDQNKLEFAQSEIQSNLQFRLLYNPSGRDISVSESVVGNTNVQVGIFIKSNIDLKFESESKDKSDITGDVVENEVFEAGDKDLYQIVKTQLISIEKSKSTSIEGTLTYLDLVNFLATATEKETEEILKKFKSKKTFKNLLDAAAGTGSAEVYKAVFKTIATDKNSENMFERFLISASFPQPTPQVLTLIVDETKSLLAAESPLAETALYSLCHLKGKNAEPNVDLLLDLIRGGKSDCEDDICRLRIVSCVSSLGRDSHTSLLLPHLLTGSDGRVGEAALAALGRPGVLPAHLREGVNHQLARVAAGETVHKGVERVAALNSLVVDETSASVLQKAISSSDTDMKSLIGQKLSQAAASLKDSSSVLNYHLLSLQQPSKSVCLEKIVGEFAGHSVQYNFATVMKGEALKRTNFALMAKDPLGRAKELVRLDSFVGGLSSYVAVDDPEDDADPNAAVELSLFGLPLRRITLFSAFSDLVDLYWSGAASELTTMLDGSISLLNKKKSIRLANGLSMEMGAHFGVSFELAGKADISLWTQSGETHVETWAVVVGELGADVGSGLLGVRSRMGGAGVLDLDTNLELGLSVTACVVMKCRDIQLSERRTQTRAGVSQSSDVNNVVPGITFNLNPKNNEMCNKISR